MLEWISVNDDLPKGAKFRESIVVMVRIQKIEGGFLTNNVEYEVAKFGSTMCSPNYFWKKTEGIVTHWAYFNTMEEV